MYLLCIRGTLNDKDLELARTTHNQTAGSDAGVAAARALGDLSHKVYAPLEPNGELLITDVWRDPAGIQTFFSSKDVQAGGAMLFAKKDPAVAMPATGAFTFSLPPPMTRTDRYLGLIRGKVKSLKEAIDAISAGVKENLSKTRMRGQLSHELYVVLGENSTEIIGVDLWADLDGMKQTYVEHTPPMLGLFTEPPAASLWKQPKGAWVEW